MTFDMTRCKVGDKLKTRGDKKVILENIWDTSDIHYPYELDNGETVTEHGSYSRYGDTDYDIVGFWEEEGGVV
jgi:hypothetical protein